MGKEGTYFKRITLTTMLNRLWGTSSEAGDTIWETNAIRREVIVAWTWSGGLKNGQILENNVLR